MNAWLALMPRPKKSLHRAEYSRGGVGLAPYAATTVVVAAGGYCFDDRSL